MRRKYDLIIGNNSVSLVKVSVVLKAGKREVKLVDRLDPEIFFSVH